MEVSGADGLLTREAPWLTFHQLRQRKPHPWMYSRKICENGRFCTAMPAAALLVAVLFGILPFVNHINIVRQTRAGGDLSAFDTAPRPARALLVELVPRAVAEPLGEAPAAPALAELPSETPAPFTAIMIPDLDPAIEAHEQKRAFIFDVSDLDFTPVPVHRVAPAYPAALNMENIEGRAVVEFLVNEDGRVSDMTVLEATHAEFGESVVAAVFNWRFVPGVVRGKAVTFRMRLPVTFRLDATLRRQKPVQLATFD